MSHGGVGSEEGAQTPHRTQAVETLLTMLERRGLLMRGEVPEGSKRVREKAKAVAEGRYMHEVFAEVVEKGLAADEESGEKAKRARR